MRYRVLGRTGVTVSEVGFGAWAIGGNRYGNSYGPTDDATSVKAVERAYDMGCNFYDTADVYGWGHSEELLGKALSGKRDRVVIATKVGGDFYHGGVRINFATDYIRFAVEKSLERLRTDYIDLYQLHNPPIEMMGQPETYEVLERLKEEGKIKFYGVSIFDPEEGIRAMGTGKPEGIQVVYNIFSQEPARVLFPVAKKKGVAIIAREPLANGFLTGKYNEDAQFVAGDIRSNWPRNYIAARVRAAENLKFLLKDDTKSLSQAALKFVLANEAVSAVIPGAKTPAQVEDNLSAGYGSPLSADDLARIEEARRDNFYL